jgi:hypothetical protein
MQSNQNNSRDGSWGPKLDTTNPPDRSETALSRDSEKQQKPSDDKEVRLDDAAQILIGQRLKSIYGQIVQQPVPRPIFKAP